MKEGISCREVFGLTICKFHADRLVFNAISHPQLNVDIFTSDYCPYCEPAIERVNSLLTPLKDMVNINVINDMEAAEKKKVEIFPTVQIGDTRITGVPEDEMVWNAVFKATTTI